MRELPFSASATPSGQAPIGVAGLTGAPAWEHTGTPCCSAARLSDRILSLLKQLVERVPVESNGRDNEVWALEVMWKVPDAGPRVGDLGVDLKVEQHPLLGSFAHGVHFQP